MEKDIYEIIGKALCGKPLIGEEQQLFDDWLEEAGNKQFYKRIRNYQEEVEVVKDLPQMDVDRAWAKQQALVKESRGARRKILLQSFVRYAAIVAIVVTVGGVMLWMSDVTQRGPQVNIASNEVVPGSGKAVLMMADGKAIHLEEKEKREIEEKDGTMIQKSGTVLKYQAELEKRSEKSTVVQVSYNRLLVPRGGEYQLVLTDGTRVRMNSESRLVYPTQFSKKQRRVVLEGEAFFEVTKDEARPFVVSTQGIDIRVLGTSFNVTSYPDEEEIKTTLVEGRVVVEDVDHKGNELVLQPGFQATFEKEGHRLKKEKVNVELYTSWKDGRFVFDQSPLEQILNKVSRWYDVKVFYMNEECKNLRFTGGLKRYDNLERMLNMIEKTNDVRFVIKEHSIMVEKKNNPK